MELAKFYGEAFRGGSEIQGIGPAYADLFTIARGRRPEYEEIFEPPPPEPEPVQTTPQEPQQPAPVQTAYTSAPPPQHEPGSAGWSAEKLDALRQMKVVQLSQAMRDPARTREAAILQTELERWPKY